MKLLLDSEKEVNGETEGNMVFLWIKLPKTYLARL